MEFHHTPVLLEETVDYLDVRPDGVYVDGTLGGGGHSEAICRRLGETGRLIGIDQDAAAVQAAAGRLAPYRGQVLIVRDNFEAAPEILQEQNIGKVDGIVLDLGVSSFQLDVKERGFSYRVEDAPLDMRMDERQARTARDIVNGYSEAELFRVIRDYGEERYAKSIARRIVEARKRQEITKSGQLNEIIRAAVPKKAQASGGHPAKRTYQAIRIELNRELEVLENTLEDMVDLLKPGGRICVITFHSLEDRIVKTVFRKCENPCTCPPDFPVCVCGKKPKGKVITKKPVLPGEREMSDNPRAKSAKLRVFERG